MKLGVKTGLGKAAAALCAALCCTLMANAQAQSNRQMRQQERREEMREERREARRDFRDNRYNDLREARERSYEGRIDDSQNNVEPQRRNGRMTADERRDLRRQINEAGQQVYSLPPKR